MFKPVSEVVRSVVPMVYDGVKDELQIHPYTDMSRSNVCHHLTLGLLGVLNRRHLPARREEHIDDDARWHYLIAHTSAQQEATPNDIITDLNPWQFDGTVPRRGYLHGERQEVQDVLATAGAPDWFISLRGVATIKRAHTLALSPFC
jgi:hypothetical protein